jgi:alkylation response protein AidB-like acyl-CoA dehydrogenase
VNFDLTEDQAMLKAMVERFCGERHGLDLEKRRRQRAATGGFDRANWSALAELGLTALPFAEADCGLGGGAIETIAVAEPMGRSLATEPFTECLVPAATLFAQAGSGQRAGLIAPVIAGETLPAFAITEQAGRYNLAHVETKARAMADGWRLSGAKSAVWQGMAADQLIVSARTEGEARARHGIALFLLSPATAGVERRAWVAADGQLAAELGLHDAPATRLDGLDLAALETAVRAAWLAASAEMLGVAGLLFDATLGYVKQRVQFGKALGSFQVVQHRLSDCYVALEQARSMVYRAALAPEAERARAIAGTKAFVSEAVRTIAHEAVQFHGGMGVTDELVVGHGLKRIQLLSRLWGDPESAAHSFAKAA